MQHMVPEYAKPAVLFWLVLLLVLLHFIYKPHIKAQYLSDHQISDRKLVMSMFF